MNGKIYLIHLMLLILNSNNYVLKILKSAILRKNQEKNNAILGISIT